tara:strand:+ start:161 stop:622 length:462 start_codon:yes stop_codon:yes gene_type:complete
MKLTKLQLKQIIKEELSVALKEATREPLERMSSSTMPVDSYNREELERALAEIPQLENPKYARGLPAHIPQWIEDVKKRAAVEGLVDPQIREGAYPAKGLPSDTTALVVTLESILKEIDVLRWKSPFKGTDLGSVLEEWMYKIRDTKAALEKM